MSAHILNLLFSHLILSQLTPAMCILYYFCILQCVRISLTKTLCSCSSYHRSSVIRLHLCGLRKHLVQSRVSLSGQNHTSVFYGNSIIASEKLRQSNDLFTFQKKKHFIYMRIEAKRVRSQLLHKLELHPRPAIIFGS